MTRDQKIQATLFYTRLSVFLVMFMWTIDKLLNPVHASKVYAKFYFISGLETFIFYAIGIGEMIILLGFLAGYKKRLTYGAVLLFHAISTLSAFEQYLDPFEGINLLFFAAWPMLAACFTLYLLRDEDTKYTIAQ